MQLFDTHAHMDADRFDPDRAEILTDMPKHQIRYLMNVGCDASSSLASVRLAEEYPFIYAAVGSHPDDAAAIRGGSDRPVPGACHAASKGPGHRRNRFGLPL